MAHLSIKTGRVGGNRLFPGRVVSTENVTPLPLTQAEHIYYILPDPDSTCRAKPEKNRLESHESYNQSTRAGMGPTHRRYVAPPLPFSTPVSLGNTMNPLRMTLNTSAPSRPPFPQRYCAADACVPSPQMISHGFYPKRACPMAVDARVPSPRMITHGSHPKRACPTTVDARVLSRMTARSALLGVEADACTNPQMISHASFRAAEGALATLILTLSPSPFHHSRPLPRGACPPKADHSGLRAGIHPLTSSLSTSRDDRPVALGVGAPNGAPTPLSPYTKGPA